MPKSRGIYWTEDRWDIGFLNRKGYFMVYRPDFPFVSNSGFANRHRVVYWLHTGKAFSLDDQIIVHHKDENKLNDKFENLEEMNYGEHTRLHSSVTYVKCVCVICSDVFYLEPWRIRQGRGKYCSQPCSKSSLTFDDRNKIKSLYKTGKYTQKELATMFNVSGATVSLVTRA